MPEHEGIFYFNSRPSARGDAALRCHASDAFQFTPLREGRHGRWALLPLHLHFNSRPSARGDVKFFAATHGDTYFNSRPSARGDGAGRIAGPTSKDFNSRPSARGDRKGRKNHDSSRTFQFTPLREGRRVTIEEFIRQNLISIHAPPRGATHPGGASRHAQANFNSRPSARGDTHDWKRPWNQSIFQFTPLREGRPRQMGTFTTTSVFQFTPLREGRRRVVFLSFVAFHFNSRPSARGDGEVGCEDVTVHISIHAPPRGATREAGAGVL